MTDLFKKNDRVLAHNKHLGTVYQDQHEGDAVVHVELDSAAAIVSGYYPHHLTKVPAEHEDYLKGHLSILVIDDVPQELFDLLSGNPWRNIYEGAVPNPEDTAVKAENFTGAGSIKNGVEEKFLYKEGDRVKLKYNKNTGTVARDQTDPLKTVLVHWDKAKPFDKSTDEKGGRELWEYPRNLTVLHAPRGSNPRQAEIDAIDAIRLPIIAQIEKDQAIVRKLNDAKKILKKG